MFDPFWQVGGAQLKRIARLHRLVAYVSLAAPISQLNPDNSASRGDRDAPRANALRYYTGCDGDGHNTSAVPVVAEVHIAVGSGPAAGKMKTDGNYPFHWCGYYWGITSPRHITRGTIGLWGKESAKN